MEYLKPQTLNRTLLTDKLLIKSDCYACLLLYNLTDYFIARCFNFQHINSGS